MTAIERLEDYLYQLARNQKIKPYEEVAPVFGTAEWDPRFWEALGVCSERSLKQHGIIISSVVVSKSDGYPGKSYFTFVRGMGKKYTDKLSFWIKETRKVHEWGAQQGAVA